MPRIERTLTVANKKGLHARPAAMFVQMASAFGCNVTVTKDQEKVNGKSIMALLMLGAQCATVLMVVTDGDDAEAAMAAFEGFFSKQEEEFNK